SDRKPCHATLKARELLLEQLDRPPSAHGLGEQAEPALIFLQGTSRPLHDVVHRRARCALMLGDLRQRPVAAQVQVEDGLLVVGEQGIISLVEGERAPTCLKPVKCHYLTAYQSIESSRAHRLHPREVVARGPEEP